MSIVVEKIPVMPPFALPGRVYESSTWVGASSHVRRVSAWAAFLGKHCGLGTGAVDLLRKAALVHHAPGLEWSGLSMQRLMEEVAPELAALPGTSATAMSSDPHWDLLFHERSCGRCESHPPELMCRIAEIAHAFDELLESVPYGEVPGRDLVAELESLFPDSESAAILSQLPCRIPLQRKDISAFAASIPISQASAAELRCLIADEDPQVRVLEALTSKDAVLACLLVRAANAAAFPLFSPISSVRQAILHIGIPKARRILIAALLRPVFGSGAQKALWNHSLNAVEASETICDLSRQPHSGEIFLASLVHDIGRAALLAGNNPQAELYGELIAEVAEVTAVEQLLFGMDHGAIGEAILEGWHFPEGLRSAVRNHHRPELSNDLLTPALYLAEFVTGSDEDMPSLSRLSTSARILGVPLPDLLRCAAEPASNWKVLRYAA